MLKQTHGFSLIEIMIVITIMGILTVIAIPSYQDYVKRARFAEVIAATEPFKIAVAIALQSGEDIAELNTGKAGIPSPPPLTKNLAKLELSNGIITATGTALVNNKTYVLQTDSYGNIWKIGGTCIEAGYCNA
jgi:type IV pilus assembly protein PilA